MDITLASHLLNCSDKEVSSLDALPEALDRLRLIHARIALLYSLGHEQLLREVQSIPKTELPEDLANTFPKVASQPNSTGRQTYKVH